MQLDDSQGHAVSRRPRPASFVAVVLFALALASSHGSLPAAAQDTLASLDARSDAPAGSEPGGGLSGRWVYLEQVTTVSDLTLIGAVYSTTRAVAIYDLEHDGDELHGDGRMCSLTMDSDSRLVRTILPPALRRAVEAPPLQIALRRRGGEVRVHQERQYRVLGASLKDPAGEALPTTPSDERVLDQDRDGHPGVTVSVRGVVDGDIYLVQRQWNELSGRLADEDRIEGTLRFGKEDAVLATTNSVLDEPPEARPVYRKSFFRLVRVPAGATCASLKAEGLARF